MIVTESDFSPLSNIPHCCRPKAYEPYYSFIVVVNPLRTTKDHSFKN